MSRSGPFVVAATLLAAAILPGCLGPSGDEPPGAESWAGTWEDDPCDPSGAESISGNAPVLDAYRGSPEEVARRFLQALGEDLPPYQGTDNDGLWHEWRNDTLSVRHESGPSGLLRQLRYTTPDLWPADDTDEGRRVIEEVLDRFGVPDHVDVRIDRPRNRFRAVQLLDGVALGVGRGRSVADALPGDGSGEQGRWSSFHLRLLHDPRGAEATHPRDETRETAEGYMRCVMDREGHTTEDGWTLEEVRDHGPAIRYESLGYTFQLDYDNPDPEAHCDDVSKLVYLDAVTGAVLGDDLIPCD